MIDDPKIRQDMVYLLGQIEALCYPLQSGEGFNQGYYDLIDSIKEQYVSILKKTIGYIE